MSQIFSFFKSRNFLLHLGLALLSLLVILLITLRWLSSYTSHGEFVVVPRFTGLHVSDLKTFIQDKDVNYMIIDSIYDPSKEKGIVLRQDPDTGAHVKHNRTVYLYVTGLVAPQMQMPKLIDRSERQARLIIETYGLKLGRITEEASDCNGCVLGQYSGGKSIEPGSLIKKGSVINLVVGRKDRFFTNAMEDSLQQGATGEKQEE
ncbi:MAG TPA: PASTA domain-containing protein [Bacteroidia bacterium]|nr:PASTA domain-containing protein [Bacteroidia bacterium]